MLKYLSKLNKRIAQGRKLITVQKFESVSICKHMETIRPQIFMVAAHTSEGKVIGNSQINDLPWPSIPIDIDHFRTTVAAKDVVMGRKTFESLQPFGYKSGLPYVHKNIVVSRNPRPESVPNEVVWVKDIDAVLALQDVQQELYIVGGAMIYKLFLPIADELILTQVHKEFSGDVQFPDYEEQFKLIESRGETDPETRIQLSFQRWVRK